MAQYDRLNAVDLMRSQLEGQVKKHLMDSIIEDQVKKLRERLVLEITPILQSITFESIETFTDMLRLRDEYRVIINVNNDVFDTDQLKGVNDEA